MANTSSPEITLLQGSPAGISDRRVSGSSRVVSKGTVEFDPNAADDTLILARVPTDATLDSLRIATDDNGGTITLDIGFYQVGSPGAAIDQNALGTVIDTSTADIAMTEYRFETQDIDTIDERMWELAGLSTRPEYEQLDIVITVVGDTTGSEATVSWYIEYTL